MSARPDRAGQLLDDLVHADRPTLVALANYGRRRTDAPTFRGRCLEPAYLEAVACGAWTPNDEALLQSVTERIEAAVLPRVGWRHRRNLRRAVRATTVSVLTEEVENPAWQRRRGDLAAGWVRALGAVPAARSGR